MKGAKKIIKDKRAERIESNNVQQEWQGKADAAQLNTMIKQLTQAMNKYMEATKKRNGKYEENDWIKLWEGS